MADDQSLGINDVDDDVIFVYRGEECREDLGRIERYASNDCLP